jgi:hypothetical protein
VNAGGTASCAEPVLSLNRIASREKCSKRRHGGAALDTTIRPEYFMTLGLGKEAGYMNNAMKRRPGLKQTSAMRHLEMGNQLFHNGIPVQLLYRTDGDKEHETWRVRPLFVEAPDRNETFCSSDAISFLHTRRASSCAA